MKPLLLGMNNPLSDDPEFDLFPYPENSMGWRLWKMLPSGTTRKQYLDAFDRLNLLRARKWNQRQAYKAAQELLPSLYGRRVIVLGTQVRAALGLPPSEPLSRHVILGAQKDLEWFAFPHPSGKNRWYNDRTNKAKAQKLLAELAGIITL